MTFSIEPWTDHTVVVHVGKALDFRNAANFKAACQDQVKDGVRNFVLDFSETGILDSTGLGSIFSLYRQVSPLEGQVVFASVSRPVQVVVQPWKDVPLAPEQYDEQEEGNREESAEGFCQIGQRSAPAGMHGMHQG